MSESIKTQGTLLYMIDPTSTTTAVKMSCPTEITGLGGAADQIETTCLEATVDRSYVRGLGNPGQVSVPFVLKAAEMSHQRLFALKKSGETMPWLICCSDGTTEPTVTSGAFVPPIDRTSFGFSAYIADVDLAFSGNDIIRGTLTLQRSGEVTPTFKPEAP